MVGYAGGPPIVRVVVREIDPVREVLYYVNLLGVGSIRAWTHADTGERHLLLVMLALENPDQVGPDQLASTRPSPQRLMIVGAEAERVEALLQRYEVRHDPGPSPNTGEVGAGPDQPASP